MRTSQRTLHPSKPIKPIILGIDPGTHITGYGILSYEGNRAQCLDFGCIRPPPSKPLSERYLIIFQGLAEILTRYPPSYLAIETQFIGINIQSAVKLSMAKAVAVVSAKLHIPHLTVYEFSPTEVKKAVVGNGRASKHQMQKMTQHILGLSESPQPEDAADALALAVCLMHRLKNPMPKKNIF